MATYTQHLEAELAHMDAQHHARSTKSRRLRAQTTRIARTTTGAFPRWLVGGGLLAITSLSAGESIKLNQVF